MSKFSITVPASSANIGPGFDSAGIAINRYLTLHVEKGEQWEFEHRSPFLPKNSDYKTHFVYQVAKKISDQYKKTLPPCKVIVESDIPLARGLGSSASAVVAGIELANKLCDLNLSTDDKLKHATEIEGHPDNVAPALLGGFIVTTTANTIEYVQLPKLNIDIVVYIPTIELKTEDARKVLPEGFSRNQAASASSVCNVMIAALLTENYDLAGRMMEADLFHEPYRAKLMPNYDYIKKEAKNMGAYGTVISGAGPTLMSFVPKDKGQEVVDTFKKSLTDYEVVSLKIATEGLQVN